MSEAPIRWHDLPFNDIERHFNPRVAVADAAERIAGWTARSEALANRTGIERDIRFGPGDNATFDLHLTRVDAPTAIFVHGGYWRALDKADVVFAADGLAGGGLNVVNLNYDLCPTLSLSALNQQIAAAIRFITDEADRLGLGTGPFFVVGHSCGAHAAALAAATPGLADRLTGIVALSGIYDTRALLHTTVNDDLRLDDEEAARLNVLAVRPRLGMRVLCVVGGEEPSAWIGESRAYHAHALALGADSRFEVLDGEDHFSMFEACCDPDQAAGRMVVDFMLGAPIDQTPR